MQIARILTQIEEKIGFNEEEILKNLKVLKTSANKNKKLKDSLSSATVDGYEEYSKEKERLEKQKTEFPKHDLSSKSFPKPPYMLRVHQHNIFRLLDNHLTHFHQLSCKTQRSLRKS